jgi:hypothetical protein
VYTGIIHTILRIAEGLIYPPAQLFSKASGAVEYGLEDRVQL